MTDTKTTGERLADQASEWALVLGEVSDGPIITSLYGTDISSQIKDVKDVLNRCSETLSTQDQQDTAMAWTLAKIRQIIGVDENTALDQLPDLVRAAVKREWLPIEDAPRDGNSVLIYSPDAFGKGTMVGIFIDANKDYDASGRGNIPVIFINSDKTYWVDAVDGELIDAEPTHYMPLPAPPQTDGEVE